MKKLSYAGILSASLLASAHAYSLPFNLENVLCSECMMGWMSSVDFVASIRGGFDYAKVAQEPHEVLFSPPLPNKYVSTQNWNSAGMFSVLLGSEFALPNDNRWQFGVAYYVTGKFKSQGLIESYSQPDLINFAYQYRIRNQRVSFENRWYIPLNSCLDFYLMEGTGIAWNKTSGYQETVLEPLALPNEPFAGATHRSFTWSVGFGAEYSLATNLRLFAGYQYSDLGKYQLGKSENQLDDYVFKNNKMQTQELLGGLTYVF